MSANTNKKTNSGSLQNIFINILIPVIILNCCSDGNIDPFNRMPDQRFWEIGPLWSLIIAISLPVIYGLHSLIKSKRFDLMSGVGIVGVALTGLISLFVISSTGEIKQATPWLFACKEALVPLILATAVLVSRSTSSPLLNTFLYTPELFDIPRIEQSVKNKNVEHDYKGTLNHASWILAGALILSSVANFFLSLWFMNDVLTLPISEQQVAYNVAIGKITWWGFLVIGVPLMVALLFTISLIIKKIEQLTGLPKNQILLR